jgi:D-alanyl-D-alanine carboxypeptidase (penicillin-binding protein 5/6)
MMPLSVRRGRQRALLLSAVFVFFSTAAVVGVAHADTTATTVQPTVDPQTATVTVKASDLGAFAATPPVITSPSAVVVNLRSGAVLFEQGAQIQRPMASTTKIMTAVLALETAALNTEVAMSATAVAVWEKRDWVEAGDVLTVEQLLYALMVESENRAAVALAEACAGTESAFVQMMNAKAAELGMNGTHYANSHGLDAPGHYSTAADLATLTRYALSDETIGEMFRKLVDTGDYTTTIQGQDLPITFQTTNRLLLQDDWVTGVKTGETAEARFCLVAAGTKEGVSMVSVVLGQPSQDACFVESRSLLEYGMSQYRYVTLIAEGSPLAEATLPYHLADKARLVAETTVGMELYKDDSVTATVMVDRPLVLPVEAGDVFGRVELSVDGSVVDTIDLVAAASISKTTLGTKLVYYLTRFGRWVKGS